MVTLSHVLYPFSSIPGGGKCVGSRVELYNGFPTPTSHPDDQVCGQLKADREFLSKSSRLVIR